MIERPLLIALFLTLTLVGCARFEQMKSRLFPSAQPIRPAEEMKIAVPYPEMVAGGRLSGHGKAFLRKVREEKVPQIRQEGGEVEILYPSVTPKSVLVELLETGARVQRSEESADFIFIFRKAIRQ